MSLELARLIEGANAAALAQHSETAARLFPELKPATLAVGGGIASFVGADSPISYAVGLGLNGLVTSDDIAQVAEFYRSRGAVPRVDVCPHADPSLLEALRAHGFGVHWFVNVLVRPLDDTVEPSADPILVRPAEPGEDELWTRVVDSGFADEQSLTESGRRLGLILFHREGMHPYLAEFEGEIAGGGAMFTHGRYAALAATSVLAAFRCRGVHAALIRTRLAAARAQGCDLAGLFTEPGSQSQRNAERHGFRVLYTKAVMKPRIKAEG